MDRSFLTNEEVIAASRNFVCIRLATYEDKEEAKFLANIFTGRSGELENTVFCLLGPDGKDRLARAGRGPHQFRNGAALASEMNKIARHYPGNQQGEPILPRMKDIRLAINVAECDQVPLVVGVSSDESELAQITATLTSLAFSKELAGKASYATTSNLDDLKSLAARKIDQGILVVTPGEFGLDGIVMQEFAVDTPVDEIQQGLTKFIAEYQQRDKEDRSHIRKGTSTGIEWETEIPVTDPMSNRARERMKGGPDQRKRRKRD